MVTADICLGTTLLEPCGWEVRSADRTPNVIVYIFDEIVKLGSNFGGFAGRAGLRLHAELVWRVLHQ
jgi:hypothetical protein